MEAVYDEFNEIESPVVLCKEDKKHGEVIGLKFKCSYCKRNHYHGAVEGHRVAHCTNPSSLYNKTGYYLKIDKQK